MPEDVNDNPNDPMFRPGGHGYGNPPAELTPYRANWHNLQAL